MQTSSVHVGSAGEQPGMLEDDVGQLPQQVVEQHQVARIGRPRPASPSSQTTWSARISARPGSRAGTQPQPCQAPGLGPGDEVAAARVPAVPTHRRTSPGPGQQAHGSAASGPSTTPPARPACRR